MVRVGRGTSSGSLRARIDGLEEAPQSNPRRYRLLKCDGLYRASALHEVIDLLNPILVLLVLLRFEHAIIGFGFRFSICLHCLNVVRRSLVVAERAIAGDGAIKSLPRLGVWQLDDLKNSAALRTDDLLAIEVEKERTTAQASPLCAKFGFSHGLYPLLRLSTRYRAAAAVLDGRLRAGTVSRPTSGLVGDLDSSRLPLAAVTSAVDRNGGGGFQELHFDL